MLPPSMPYRHAIAQLYLAVSELVGHGDLRQRLEAAYAPHLANLRGRHMPEELQEEYENLRSAFTWVPVERPGEGTLLSTLRAMPEEERERVAKKVLELLDRTLMLAWEERLRST